MNMMTWKPAWLRRLALIGLAPWLILFSLIWEPLWAGLKMLAELLESFQTLPHALGEVWAGERLRVRYVGVFAFPGGRY